VDARLTEEGSPECKVQKKFKVQSLKFKVGNRQMGDRSPEEVQSLKFKVQSSKFKVQSSKFKVQSSKFKVQGSKSKV
jgi:hypothetical protein